MRNQVILTIISVCLLLCATLIFVYSSYAHHHVTAEARVWVDTGKGYAKVTVKAPLTSCEGTYNRHVMVKHGGSPTSKGPFRQNITKSLSASGTPSEENYAGGYIYDTTAPPHNGDIDSDNAYAGP